MERKCTFGIRMPIKRHMLYEIIYREVKHFRNYKTYRPNFGVIPVAGKFYAAHDLLKDLSPEETKKIDKYFNKVAQSRALGPHNKYSSPATENQAEKLTNEQTVHLILSDPVVHGTFEELQVRCQPEKLNKQVIRYGWYTTPLIPFDRNDIRFYHPVLESRHTKTEVIIKMANPRKRRKE